MSGSTSARRTSRGSLCSSTKSCSLFCNRTRLPYKLFPLACTFSLSPSCSSILCASQGFYCFFGKIPFTCLCAGLTRLSAPLLLCPIFQTLLWFSNCHYSLPCACSISSTKQARIPKPTISKKVMMDISIICLRLRLAVSSASFLATRAFAWNLCQSCHRPGRPV